MEKWDVYDKYGNATGIIKTKYDIWNEGEYHLGATLWIINHKGEILIQKRAATKSWRPNIWGNVGGSVAAGETSRQGCVREVLEEVGIKVNADEIVFIQRFFFKDIICDDYALICNIPIEQFVIQQEEVSEVKWASVDEIRQLFLQGIFMLDCLEDIEKVVEYIGEHVGDLI